MKNTRRLIPVFALLLVTAVMLSTASYAWFTMNTEVTASGMQLQAKADSSLVIANEPLTSSNGAPSVFFKSTTVNKLTPITYNAGASGDIQGAQLATGDAATGFVAPQFTTDVNIQTGIYNQNAFVPAASGTYIEEMLYIASAGDAIDSTNVTFELSAPSVTDNGAYKAYAAAIYVEAANTDAAWPTTGVLAADATPDAIIFVDTTEGRFTCTIEDVAIPSVIGAGEGDNPAVGVKVVVRFFVDGALKDLVNKIDVDAGYLYASAATYTAGGNYFKPTFTEVDLGDATTVPFGCYTETDGVYTQVSLGAEVDTAKTYYQVTAVTPVILSADQQTAGAALPAGSYTRAMGKDKAEYTFVRTALVPSGGTELVLAISTGT